MAGDYQGQKHLLGLTAGDWATIVGASFGRAGVGHRKGGGPLLQPGYFLRPLGNVLGGAEERGREKWRGEQFAESLKGLPLDPMQQAFTKTEYGREMLPALLSRKSSTYGQPISPERQAQILEAETVRAGLRPEHQTFEQTKELESMREATAMARTVKSADIAARRASILAGRRGSPDSAKAEAASRRSRLVEIKEQAGMVASEMNAVTKQLEVMGLGEENNPMRTGLSSRLSELRARHAELLGEYGDLARGAPAKGTNGAQAPQVGLPPVSEGAQAPQAGGVSATFPSVETGAMIAKRFGLPPAAAPVKTGGLYSSVLGAEVSMEDLAAEAKASGKPIQQVMSEFGISPP